MSRAFVKDDATHEQVLVPPRAHLPPGIPNYVTSRGLALLGAELAELKHTLSQLETDPTATSKLASLSEQIRDLDDRIANAKLITPADISPDQVGFGATVTVETLGKSAVQRRFSLVGVDQASAAEGRVAFTAPIAQALMGHKVGETVRLEVGTTQPLKIISIDYET